MQFQVVILILVNNVIVCEQMIVIPLIYQFLWSICLSIYLSIFLSINQSIYLSIYLFFCLSIFLSIHITLHLSFIGHFNLSILCLQNVSLYICFYLFYFLYSSSKSSWYFICFLIIFIHLSYHMYLSTLIHINFFHLWAFAMFLVFFQV